MLKLEFDRGTILVHGDQSTIEDLELPGCAFDHRVALSRAPARCYRDIVTRLTEGRSPAQGGKDHSSHRLMLLGFSQRQTLFILYGGCGLFGHTVYN